MRATYPLLFFLSLIHILVPAQNQNAKWYFGVNAALDFMQSPPVNLPNSAMVANFDCASQADENGNLLFYTDGMTVYNQNNVVMANGAGLLANGSPYQGCLIVQKPGSSNLYYIFTVEGNGSPGGLKYSIVDMNLAAGQGSVITKNAAIYSGACVESLTGTWHCNGKDYWIVTHEAWTDNIRVYLLNASGINTTAIVSAIGPVSMSYNAIMKFSPGGNRFAIHTHAINGLLNIFDFDNSSGVLTNYLQVSNSIVPDNGGLEFSPDGSKLYCTTVGILRNDNFNQWDLCAGSLSAIAASHFTLAVNNLGNMQLAPDGKIYVAVGNSTSIGVINNPDMAGVACNFVLSGQSLGGKLSAASLPNQITRYKTRLVPFTYTLSPSLGCHAMSFTANLPLSNCTLSNFSVTGVSWDFGDPATGTLNVSTSQNPAHLYSSSGTYTATLVFNYRCSSDTIRQIIQIPPPNIGVSLSPDCNGKASATAVGSGGIGPYTFSWSPSAQTGSFVSNLNAGTHTVILSDAGLACKVESVITVTVNPVSSFSLSPPAGISICEGDSKVIQISGNCNSFSIYPQNGATLQGTMVTLSPAKSQTYTLTGSLNNCTTSLIYTVQVLSLPNPTIVSDKNTVCLNSVLKLVGIGGLSYFWEGPAGFISEQSEINRLIKSNNELGNYKLYATDVNGCKNFTTVSIGLSPLPTGVLNSSNDKGCAPFWSDFEFLPGNASSTINTSWEINKTVFTDKFRYYFDTPGTYTITGMLVDPATSCSNTVFYFIEVYPKPIADYNQLPELVVENSDEKVIFTSTSTGEEQNQWSWYFYSPDHSSFSTNLSGKSVSNYFSEAGLYTTVLVVTNKWDCTDTLVKTLQVAEDYLVWVPNAFSPNDDSENDVFIPVTRGVKSFNLQIFNRWGTLIFQGKTANEGWDGNYKGQAAQQDIYTWILTTSSIGGEEKKQTGYVFLLR